ncbi:MAG: nitroreductase [Treponema sp. GWB1_62_6]|nr:MAG: nitroreductase [Treponema sp. GWB1_62_6]OHE68172.1 MAG: nitroreductase [Treponema sp. GWC1_61_84]HCM28348.1 nitroreductase [Treponema sp.]
MNIFEAIAKRRSVRSYLDKPVEREKIESIFNAVRLAPSARNAQEWRFILVTDARLRAMVAEAGGQPFLRVCPAIVVACAETDGRVMRCGETAYPIDLAIAIDHLTLAAAAMGVGTCWIGSFEPEPVREALGIPASVPIVGLIALGYPADDSEPGKHRLRLDEILMENGWKEPWR